MNKFKLITICTAFLLSILGVVGFSNTLLFNSPSNNLIAEASNPAINIEQKCYLKETNQTCPMLDKQQASYIKPDQEFIYQIRLTNNTNSTIENLQMQIVNNSNVNISLINDLSNMRNLEQNQKAEYYLKGELSNSAKQSVITGETIFVQNTINITTKTDILTNTSVQLVSNNQNDASQISFPTSLMSNKATTSSAVIPSNSQNNNLNSSESSKTSSNTSSSSVINAISSANSSSLTSNSKSNLIKNNLLKIDLSCSNKQNGNQLCLDIKNDSDVTYRIQVTNSSDKNLTNSKLHIKHNIEQMVLDSKPNLNNSNQSNFGVKNNESDKDLEIPLIKSNEKLEITFNSLLKISEFQKTPIVTMIIITNDDQSEPSILTYKIPQIANQKSSQTSVQNTNSSTSSSNVITERAKITNLSITTPSSSNSSINSANPSSSISTTTNSNTTNKTLSSTIATSNLSSSLLSSSPATISKTSLPATVRTGAQENLVIFSSSFGIIGIMVLFLKKNLKKLHR